MPDLVHGRYGIYDPIWGALGRPTNATQSDIAVRSNAWYFGLSALADNAIAATKKGYFVAIPVQEGDVISKVSMLVGKTEGETIANTFAAVYSGLSKEGVLLGQSKTSTTATITKNKTLTAELEKSILVTSVNAPNGYVYAGFNVEGTTIPTAIGYAALTKEAAYEWFTGTPKAFAVEGTLKEAGVAETKLSTTVVEKAPLVFLQ